jgi:RNA polymerase sigma-70 factor (ECF subfamily)
MPASLVERTLIQRCCDGDRSGYRELYDLYSGGLLAIAMRYMKSKSEAEDVLQESFIKIFKNLASFDSKSVLRTWMTRIVINTALNMLRKEHNKINWHTTDGLEITTGNVQLHEYHFTELIGIIQQLPQGCKTIFNMYAIEGYTHKEIGELLEISEGTSKSQYFRAKRILQDKLLSEDKRTKVRLI